MKSRETLARLRRFDVEEHQQKVADIEMMIADFKQMAADLERQIEVEQERAGVSDVNHYAYPTFAKAAIQRRENLLASIGDLEAKLVSAREDLAEAFEELKKVELIQERDAERNRVYANAVEQSELDEMARLQGGGVTSETH
jgi:flagellar export protein FliJ